MKDPTKLHELYGETVELITPSGFKVTLRQQNGDDDDVISNAVGSEDGTSINRFVSGIVIDTDLTVTGKLSLEDILRLKLCDKYFIIIASRIFSLGQIMKFSFQWKDIVEPVEYEEDLAKYIWDYSKPDFPSEKKDPRYFENRIKPHTYGKDFSREFIIATGKKLMYDYMNGNGEKYLLTLDPLLQSKNQELLARNIQLWLDNKWIKVENFKNFNPLEMVEIRKEVLENDATTELTTELENPITHNKIPFLIVGTPDFFFPREI
jgi:hypothetical protein